MKSWLPDGFEAPRSAKLAGLRLVVLSPDCADEDFAAVQASADTIRGVFGPGNGWPASTLTEAENRGDLVRHARQFDERSACAYALRDADSGQYLGCLYLKPVKSRLAQDVRRDRFQAQAFMWLDVRQSAASLEAVRRELATWVKLVWPFHEVAWPGYAPDWVTWHALALDSRPLSLPDGAD